MSERERGLTAAVENALSAAYYQGGMDERERCIAILAAFKPETIRDYRTLVVLNELIGKIRCG